MALDWLTILFITIVVGTPVALLGTYLYKLKGQGRESFKVKVTGVDPSGPWAETRDLTPENDSVIWENADGDHCLLLLDRSYAYPSPDGPWYFADVSKQDGRLIDIRVDGLEEMEDEQGNVFLVPLRMPGNRLYNAYQNDDRNKMYREYADDWMAALNRYSGMLLIIVLVVLIIIAGFVSKNFAGS